MRLLHCERCRFNFEAPEPSAPCPQCGAPSVLADEAIRGEESSTTHELKIIELPKVK